MITQKYNQGEHEIKIEIAETIEDAKQNNFKEGQYSRYFVDGKLVDNYMAMIRFIVDESKKNKITLVPTSKNLVEKRKELFSKQKDLIKEQFNKLKAQYQGMNTPEEILQKIDEFQKKINTIGLRVEK